MSRAARSAPKRTLFYVDHVKPTRPRDPRPCAMGHVGPLLRTDEYDRFGGVWRGTGDCGMCGSTIHTSQLLRSA